uniref:Uncharacterized protein n=1 Tax=Anopheles maculatus TaxID=74869 RepID=A0A182SZS7_9DIPT
MVRSVDDHKIAETLRKTYDRLGEEQARQLVLELHAFGSNDWGTCISYTKQIASSLSQGFARALQKTPNQTRALKILSNISTAWVWTERAIELGKLMTVVGTFLDQLDYKMNEKLNSTIKQRSSPVSEASRPNGKFEEFRAKIVNEWKAQLTEHVRSIIAQHLVKPLLHDTLYRVGRLIKRVPRNIRQGMLKRRTKRLLQKHAQRMQDSSLSQETKANLRQEYHDKLLKILYKTKSPSLFASIIRENVPMDLTCAAACTPVVHELLSNMGKHVDGITITVKGEHGIEQTFCSGSLEGKNVREVTLQLKDNHFTFSDNQRNTANNNCLYAALSAAIPELETIGAEQLREQIANTIRDDTGLQHRIRQGWHRFPIKKYGAVGGRSLPPEEGPKRAKTFRQQPTRLAAPRASDEDRLKSLAVEFEEYTAPENCPNAKSAALHLYARVTIYDYEFAGLVQGIAVKTGISVEELIEQGPSNCKDQLKLVKGGHIHRAHTVRVKVNEQALKNWPEELAKLKQYAGHREYVCKEANQFDKIGGVIDRKQMMWIKQLVKTHDFSKTPTANDKLSMQKHLEEAGQVFDVNHTAGKYDATMIQQMRLAKKKILN